MPQRNMHDESVSNRLRKAQMAKVLFLAPFLLLVAIFFRYQVLHTSEYTLHSEENRLRRIEGQARGLAKMVEEDRYCIDIMQQIASLRAAADAVALVLLRDHLDGCVREAVLGGGGAEKIDEVVEAVRRYSRS